MSEPSRHRSGAPFRRPQAAPTAGRSHLRPVPAFDDPRASGDVSQLGNGVQADPAAGYAAVAGAARRGVPSAVMPPASPPSGVLGAGDGGVFYPPPPTWTRSPNELVPPSSDLFLELPVWRTADLAPDRLRDLIDVRHEVINRITMFNAMHADEAFRRRYERPIGPYAVALLFWLPRDDRGRQLRTDVRLYPSTEATTHRDDILAALSDLVYRGWAAPDFDVRGSLCTRLDDEWTSQGLRDAAFFGVALSALARDSGKRPWNEARRNAASSDDLPGEVLVQCVDGGRFLISRRGGVHRYAVERSSSVPLLGVGFAPFQWRFDPDLNRIPLDDPYARTWHGLAELARMIYWGWGRPA